MTDILDHSRTEWHPTGAAVLDSNGNPRPRLNLPLDWATVHWGGAGGFSDPGDTITELRNLDFWATNVREPPTPNEYNVVVDSESRTWEYAGPFQAAHSLGENHLALGILALAGPSDDLINLPNVRARYVHGIRRARWQAVQLGWLTPGHRLDPHFRMPGASTQCPGPLAEPATWAEISAPVLIDPDTPITPPDPPPPDEETSIMRDARIILCDNHWFLWLPAVNRKQLAGGSGADPKKILARWRFTIAAAGGDASTWEIDDLDTLRSLGPIDGKKPFHLDRYGVRISRT